MPRGNPREPKKLVWGKGSYIGTRPTPSEGESIHARGRAFFGKDYKKGRSRKKRCPKCKKLRMWWMHPNMETPKRHNRVYKIDNQRVCHVCWKRSDEGIVEEVHQS